MSSDDAYIDYTHAGKDGSTFGGGSGFATADGGSSAGRGSSRRASGPSGSSGAGASGSRSRDTPSESDRSTIRGNGTRSDTSGSPIVDRKKGLFADEKGSSVTGSSVTGSSVTGTSVTGTSGTPRSYRKGEPISEASFDSQSPTYDDRSFYWDHVVPLYGNPTLLVRAWTEMTQAISFGLTLFGFNFLVIFAFGRYLAWNAGLHKYPPRPKVEKDWWNRITGERYSGRLEYYAEFWGYECEQHDVETEDGFVLRLHHLLSAKHRVRGHPVLLQHGILCNSVNFVLNEERSMAFWLLEQGYDVWLSNIRTNFKQPHRKYGRWDPRYWAWSFPTIGLYDCVASVNYVYEATGSKVAYVGHSQGGGTMFLALSRGARPELGEKMSCFIALAPAVYAGDILQTFPFNILRLFTSRQLWQIVFGVREFFPVLSLTQEYLPGWFFGYIAFVVFQFLFNFTDANWVPRQIPKFFRSVPMANSSELLFYYMASFSHRKCIFQEVEGEPWLPKSFPPLALFWGTADTLVDCKPLVPRLEKCEPNIQFHREVRLEGYEHLDLLWSVNLIPDVLVPMREVIEETRSGIDV